MAHVLLSKGCSVKVVSGRAGFGSATSLSRAFSRHLGYAPNEIGKHHPPLRK
ncbi:hypothetical protein [Neorhizobium huautlense]|uniref:hypothetical protein n=1 Tax=Neorhizobium huautlense TaxID=67774 RepID=UPI003CC9D0AD